MAYVQKENSGSLFKNDRKEKETHPDYKGDINIGGVNYWISGWIKDTKTGGKFLSLSVNMKEAPRLSKQLDDKPKQKPSVQHNDPFEDSEIPF